MNNLLYWLSSRLPCRIISDDGRPYLERYYIGSAFKRRFYLHRFVGSDPAHGLHDHPWPWAKSIVLSGWYYEDTRSGTRQITWFNRLTGDTFHRVILPSSRPCWTLFWHSTRSTKPWGFLQPQDSNGSATWTPYKGEALEKPRMRDWWKRAPLGRDEIRREPRSR